MAANPNSFNYWLRQGSVFVQYTLGKVAGTADSLYWERAGTIAYPADIQPASSAVSGTAAETVNIDGETTGSAFLPATSAGSLTLSGAATGTAFLPATDAGSVTLTGSATGTTFLPATDSGSEIGRASCRERV